MDQPTLLFDFIYYQNAFFPQEKAYSYKYGGEWVSFSTREVIEIANKISRGLLKMGVKPGDKIAMAVYKNRPEWVLMDIGMNQIGAINVPVYPTISSNEYAYIFKEAEISYAFVGDGDLYDKVKATQEEVPSLKEIYTFDKQDRGIFWKDIFSDEGQEQVEEIKAGIKPDDLATLIYTSGTTGNPKGVMLTHHNIVSNALSVSSVLDLDPGDRCLSFLPICHIFERTATYFQTYKGLNVYYCGTDNLGGEEGDIKAIKPHYFNTVPRLLEKVYEKIYAKGEELSGAKKKIFYWALKLTEDYEIDKEYKGAEKLKRKLADKLIYSKWREALGGNIMGILSGAAPLPTRIAQFFNAGGIPIREGYGLTETSPGLTIGRFEKGRALLGTIGPVIDGVEIMIDPSEGEYKEGEGEVLAKGPNIMMGYYKKPKETAEVFKEIDGVRWFKTGDIGKLIEGSDGTPLLKITDRKKELLKTSGGKYVAPAPIESRFKEDFLVEQVMVVGEKRKFVSALIVPSEEGMKNFCKNEGISWTTLPELIQHPKVLSKFQEIIDKVNPEFSHIEQVKKFALLGNPWLPIHPNGEESELTPTLKLKRRVIRKKFESVIEEIYH